ncbi:MAG: beta-propeller domain-containing protein [Desulfamplus sp.]|nr:beta-propeller domain-containing protein [Desulfamplus sp.]
MKDSYNEDSNIIYDYEKSSRHDGLKSLLYFFLMAALLLSMLFLPERSYAQQDRDIKFGVQLTDKTKLLGTISGRFTRDFDAADLYIIAYLESKAFLKESIFSLNMQNKDPKNLVWKNQISMVSTYSCIKAGGWASLSSIDFTPLTYSGVNDLSDFVFAAVVVKNGGDPLNPDNWLDSAVTSIITEPNQRVTGQTQFVTDQINDRYYPVAEDGSLEPTPPPSPQPDKDNEEPSQVEKPDIYKISNGKIFYANASASKFQVVDIANPTSPALIYSEPLDNTPLDIYINGDYVTLLEQISDQDSSAVVLKIFYVQGSDIKKVAEQAYDNINYIASKRLGNRLFITGTDPFYYYPYSVDVVDEFGYNGSVVVAIDLSNPQAPMLLSKKTLEGYDSEIYLSNDYLVQIARVNWESTILNLFDLNQSDPLTKTAQIKISGRVPSEYHLNISGNSLFAIYRDQNIEKGSFLKVFDVKSGKEIGAVDGIAPKEELFAATFTEDRAYIVTYERKDPLWVVDISDHSAPKIVGELEVPGWSEYIRFYKDRLIALGYDDSDGKRRVSLALFSVKDPLNPTLLDRVTPLSNISDYTYSVAVEDDRGFYLNKESGIIMFPISYYSDASYSGLEVVRVDDSWSSFTQDDFVKASFNVQRAAKADESNSDNSLEDIALSIGDAALNTINISLNTKPVVVGELRLSYNVEKIALYENSTPSNANGAKSIFAVGGDFYLSGTSEFMRYDSKDASDSVDGQFDFTKPDAIKDSGLIYPELFIDKDGFGVIFSWSSAAFRLFDQKTMAMGDVVKIGDTSNWATSEPIVSNQKLYFAVSQYYYPKYETQEDGEITDDGYPNYDYLIKTTLKQYDCSNIDSPKELQELSIPGTPKAIFNSTRLITIETYRDYYYPYPYDYEKSVQAANPQGLRINALELGGDNAVLDSTAFFDLESYGDSEVVCDEKAIYLVSVKDEETKIYEIDFTNLNIINSYTLKGQFSPVKADKGRIILTSRFYYPYWRYGYAEILPPYWNSSEIKVVDVSGGVLNEVATLSNNNLYAANNNIIIEKDGLYIANGYRGVLYFSTH